MSRKWIAPRRGLIAGACLAVALMVPAAAEATPQAAGTERVEHAQAAPQAQAAGICGKDLWKSGKRSRKDMGDRLEWFLDRLDDADATATVVSGGLAILSGGSATPAAIVVKLVSKVGTHGLKKVLKRLAKQVTKLPRRKKSVGVKVKINCKWGLIPHPSVGIYT